tara:strand:+ start:864 stop:1244 length:381 start_codon:yes stop_codon:yes gene_type:complete
MEKLITIGELSKKLKLLNTKTQKPLNYVLRYWEKEFKQIKPKIINKRRYYSSEQVEIIKLIQYLLKINGMTIIGVKKVLNSDINQLDDSKYHSLKAGLNKIKIKYKSNKLLEKINNIKKYGKKNSH